MGVLVGGLLLGSAVLTAHTRAFDPAIRVDDPLPVWARALFEEHLPAISWATARVALGEPRARIEDALRPLRAEPLPPAIAGVLRDLARPLTRPGLRPRAVREHFEALNRAVQAMGLPLYANVEFEQVPPETGKWVVWVATYRVVAVRDVQTSAGAHRVHWLERLDQLGVREDRLGWKKAHEPQAAVLLDVVRRHWREDLAPRLAANPGRGHARHLYARLRTELLSELERALGPAVVEDVACRAQHGTQLGLDSPESVSPEALRCWSLTRAVEPAVVALLARRVEHHELQHAIDARALEVPGIVSARCAAEAGCVPEQVTAELSAVLAEIARGPLPRLTLAHFLSMGAERGHSAGMAAEVVLQLLRGPDESALSLSRRPSSELALRARKAYQRLFERPLADAVF